MFQGVLLTYQSGDDPRLLNDLHSALKRWHRSTLGEESLAGGLKDVARRMADNPGLTQAQALRHLLQSGLGLLREKGRTGDAELLEGHYIAGENAIRLADRHHLSERTIYLRLEEARLALAHSLWALEQPGAGGAEPTHSSILQKTRHLPPPTCTQLFGIDDALSRLLEYLHDDHNHWLICLDGMAGLGKTALAREAARQLAETDRFADIAWVTVRPAWRAVRGLHQPDIAALTCEQVLDALAHQLDGPPIAGQDLLAKRDQVRELMRSRSCLVVLDNMEAVMDCGVLSGWLWGLAKPSKFLLTSRHWLEADLSPSVLTLAELDESESMALIRHEARLMGLQEMERASDQILTKILSVTGGNPLAIKLVIGQLASLPLGRILTALQTVEPGTDAFYRYLYSVSWDLISQPARHLLVQIALLPAPIHSWQSLASASGLSEAGLSSAVEELVGHGFVQASGLEEKLYSLHPLTQHFALSQASESDCDPSTRTACPA